MVKRAGKGRAWIAVSFACWAFGCSTDSEKPADGSTDKGVSDKGVSDKEISDEGVADKAIPDAKNPCTKDESFFTSVVDLDTAQFAFTACTGMGAGHTIAFRLVEVRFKDSSEMLPEKDRGRSIVLSEDQIVEADWPDLLQLPEGKQLIYSANHHNACDSFHVTFAGIDASYAATSSARAGCGVSVGNAPERTMDDANDGLWYRTKYPGQDWGDKKVHPTREHFLLEF